MLQTSIARKGETKRKESFVRATLGNSCPGKRKDKKSDIRY